MDRVRRSWWSAVAVGGIGLAVAAGQVGPGPATGAVVADAQGALTEVIVGFDDESAARRAITVAGGRVSGRLGLVNSLVAAVPSGRLSRLAAGPGVRSVTGDGRVRLQGAPWRTDADQNSLRDIAAGAGAHTLWSTIDRIGRPVTGKGIGVALIDSGIAPVEGLNAPGKVVNGPDLSFESQAPNLRHTDTFGHGTHMAGIIAGRDSTVSPGAEADPRTFTGIAPDATLVNVKVAAADGAVDVSQVIAAIDWVVAHRNDPGLNIRVLNLSFGTDSTQDARLDPLSHAVEAAWRHGIVVVVAVGNEGASAPRVTMPAANPYVIAVGGADPRATTDRADDTVGDFSSRGSTARHADLVAAGRSVVSLRAPGSYVDTLYPDALLPDDRAQRLFRGTGTSQATAVVAGAAALLLQQRPTLTPDQVKRLLTTTAAPMPGADPIAAGAGQLDIAAAAAAPVPAYVQTWPASLGTGSLEAARGSAHVADPDTGTELVGERDIMGHVWNGRTWSTAALTGRTWSGGTWNGRTWSGSTWSGTSWASRTWSGVTWTGTAWSGRTWSGRTWSSATWTGVTWSGRTWSGRTWSGRTWSGGCWA